MKKFLLSFVAAMICTLGANAEVWKKVTNAPADWSGKYLIACDNGEDWAVLNGSRSGDPTTGNLQSTMNYKPYDLNAEGNIETTDCNYYVTIAQNGSGYTICTASGWYIGNNADVNTLGTTTDKDAYINTINLDAEQGVLIKAVEGGSVLRYNHMNGQDRFRFYKSTTYTNQQKIALYKLDDAQAPVVPTTVFKGVITPNLTSVSSLADLEGIQLTFVDADQVSVSEYGDGLYVQSKLGDKFYAIWHPGFGGTCEIDGNVVTLRNFFTDNSDGYFDELDSDVKALYFEDYGTFDVSNADADWDGYCQTFSVAYEGAPAAQPFELLLRNNNIICENGKKVEAHEAGVAVDFYLVNEGISAVGKNATLYKDGNAMNFVMTFVDDTAISFLGGSSLITEPGAYTLEVPEGTYVDAAGNPNIAYYGTWVIIQKDEPIVEPTKKDKYTIRLDGTDYYFTTTEVKDNSFMTYSISTTPEYFYIEPSAGGYTIKSADTDKWVGYDVVSSWDFSNDEKVWTIGNLEGEPTLIRKNGSKGFGVDNQYEGAGVYTDKSYQYWVIAKVVEEQPESTIWNGNINYPTVAAGIDDLLTFSIDFEEANEVKASNLDVLAAVYDETGNPYAIALCNGNADAFGSLSIDKSVATICFQKIADLGADLQTSAKAAASRIGGFATSGNARVAFAGKSFVVDGQLITDVLTKEYTFDGATPTSISTIATEAISTIFDLQGRRVSAVQKGIFLTNGKKIVK